MCSYVYGAATAPPGVLPIAGVENLAETVQSVARIAVTRRTQQVRRQIFGSVPTLCFTIAVEFSAFPGCSSSSIGQPVTSTQCPLSCAFCALTD